MLGERIWISQQHSIVAPERPAQIIETTMNTAHLVALKIWSGMLPVADISLFRIICQVPLGSIPKCLLLLTLRYSDQLTSSDCENMASSSGNPRYARRVSMSTKPDKAGKFVSVMKDSVFPRTKRCAGARRLYLLRSTQSSNDFVVLTLWDSKKDADGYGSSEAYAKNSEELLPLVTSEPSLTEYDVVVHDVNAEDLPPPKTAEPL